MIRKLIEYIQRYFLKRKRALLLKEIFTILRTGFKTGKKFAMVEAIQDNCATYMRSPYIQGCAYIEAAPFFFVEYSSKVSLVPKPNFHSCYHFGMYTEDSWEKEIDSPSYDYDHDSYDERCKDAITLVKKGVSLGSTTLDIEEFMPLTAQIEYLQEILKSFHEIYKEELKKKAKKKQEKIRRASEALEEHIYPLVRGKHSSEHSSEHHWATCPHCEGSFVKILGQCPLSSCPHCKEEIILMEFKEDSCLPLLPFTEEEYVFPAKEEVLIE